MQMLIICCWFGLSLSGQYYPYTLYTADDGLPSNNVYRILQDTKGQIWIATINGIAKYDGYSFKTFKVPEGLPSNDVFHLVEDYNNRIWIFNDNNILSCIRNDSIITYSSDASKRHSIENITKDSVWVDDGNFIHVFDQHHYIRSLDRDQYIQKILDQWEIIAPHKKGSLYIQHGKVRKTAYKLLNIDSTRLCYYSISNNKILRNYLDASGIQSDTFMMNKNIDWPIDRPLAQYDITNQHIQIFQGENLCIIQKDNQRKFIDILLPNKEEINTVFYDHNENLWVSIKEGVLFIDNNVIKNKILTEQRSGNSDIFAISKYREKYIYTTKNGDVYIYDEKDHEALYMHPLTTKMEPIYDMIIKNDHLFIAYKNLGILVFDLRLYQGNPMTPLTLDEYIRTSSPGFKFSSQKEWNGIKEMFIADDAIDIRIELGLIHMDFNDSEEKRLWAEKSFKFNNCSERYIISNKDGLFLLQQDDLQNIDTTIDKIRLIECLDADYFFVHNDHLQSWICSEGGCISQKSLDGFSVQSLQFRDKYLWIVHSEGIVQSIYDPITKNISVLKQYPINPFTNSNRVNDVVIEEDRLVIATNKGIYYVNRQNFEIDKKEITLHIKSIKTDKEIFTAPKNISLAYDDRSIGIDFTSLSFTSNNTVLYNYQLVGVDKTMQTTENRSIRYPDLKPGLYTFNIYASDALDRSSKQHSIQIEIRRPWWLSPYFFFACVVLSFLIFYIIYRSREKQLLHKIEISKRFAELELNALQSQMNPHFVFNAMGSLQNLVQNNQIDLADTYIAKFAKLMRLFLEGSKHKFVTIQEEVDIVLAYFELEKLRFKDKIHLEFQNDLSEVELEQKIPANMLQPFVENAINHGIFHKKSKGTIHINLLSQGDQILIQIIDDGVGRKKAASFKENYADQHKSRAIEILDDKINAIKKLEGINIEYEIIDLYEDELPKGTCVNIYLKK